VIKSGSVRIWDTLSQRVEEAKGSLSVFRPLRIKFEDAQIANGRGSFGEKAGRCHS
jgi:hypothetical protein